MPVTQPKQVRYKQFLELFEAPNKFNSEDSSKSSEVSTEYGNETVIADENEEIVDEEDTIKGSSEETSSDDSDSDFNAVLKDSQKINEMKRPEDKDDSESSKCSRYSSAIKLNVCRLLDLNETSQSPIFTREETYCLQFINIPSPMLDSLLLQKLTHLDNDLAEKLIYECLLNIEKINYSDDELDEESLKKLETLRKSISICDDDENKEILSLEIYNILHLRLFNDKSRAVRMFINTLDQLNEKSKFNVSHNDILLMLDKTRKPKKKVNANAAINKKLGKNTQANEKQKINKKETTVVNKTDEKKEQVVKNEINTASNETEDKEEKSSEEDSIIKGSGDNITTKSDIDDNLDELFNDDNYREDCTKMIQDFKQFLSEHCHAGVQSLGKVITSHISDTMTKIKNQKLKNLQLKKESDEAKSDVVDDV